MNEITIDILVGESTHYNHQFTATPEIATLERVAKQNTEYIVRLKKEIEDLKSR